MFSGKCMKQSFRKSLRTIFSQHFMYRIFRYEVVWRQAPENDEDLTSPLVAVEVKPQVLQCQLPPSMRRKKFGAM